ncbi:MAG: preprotein translocase subunit SecG [Candidatus Magasanikbacteria bacterium]|jgi:preprotein translocase subunit SecG
MNHISVNYYQKFVMKELILNSIQLILAIILIVVILLQQKGTGLSGVFGGSGNVFSTKRGLDKILHYITIGAVVVFFVVSLVRLVI